MISRRGRLLFGALQGALETGLNMVSEAAAHRRGFKLGHEAALREMAARLRRVLDTHFVIANDQDAVEQLRDAVLDIAIHAEQYGTLIDDHEAEVVEPS